MGTKHMYMDGQQVMLWDLAVLAEALHVVDEINAGDEPWAKE